MQDQDEPPPESSAVGDSWNEFEAKVLPAISEDLSAATLAVSQLSFYFGALTMLNIVQAVMDEAASEVSVEIALDGLRDEVEGFIEASDRTVN